MGEIIDFKSVSQEQLKGIVSEYSFPKPVFSNYYNNVKGNEGKFVFK